MNGPNVENIPGGFGTPPNPAAPSTIEHLGTSGAPVISISPPAGALPPQSAQPTGAPARTAVEIQSDAPTGLRVLYAEGTRAYTCADPLGLQFALAEWLETLPEMEGTAQRHISKESLESLYRTMTQWGRFTSADGDEIKDHPTVTQVYMLQMTISRWVNDLGKD